jgi:dolichyl-phosphate beta-glucosyltransferase
MKLSVVIPAYNEADRIVMTLDESIAYLGRQDGKSEILVVSDGSTDHTGRVVAGYRTPANVTLDWLEYFPNRGKGYAVRYGMRRATGEVVMFMDADYSVPMSYAAMGMALIEKGCDIAIASRAVTGAQVTQHQNPLRELSARAYTLVQNTFLGLRHPDTQCGFKLFTRAAARDLFARQKLSSVIFDPEILYLAKKRGYRVADFPVAWEHREDSRIQYDSLKKSLFVFQELFRIRSLHRQNTPPGH